MEERIIELIKILKDTYFSNNIIYCFLTAYHYIMTFYMKLQIYLNRSNLFRAYY